MKERIEVLGEMFRFITPVLIAIVGYVSISYLSSIDRRFENINSKFDSAVISYHLMDKRIEKLEIKVFNQ